MNKKTNKNKIVGLLLIVLIGVIVWVGFSVYFSVNKEDTDVNAEAYTKHLKPNFDLEIIESVKERIDNSFEVEPEIFLEYRKE